MKDFKSKIYQQLQITALLALAAGMTFSAYSADQGMVEVPAGWYLMGDSNDNTPYETTHNVYVSTFEIESNLVSYALWKSVYQAASGYAFSTNGAGFADNNPVQSINWYDAVKWCNARSAQEHLDPCYYTDAALTQVYTNGQQAPYVNWRHNGYRLPTEAEFEKAARGGSPTNRFPNGMYVSHTQPAYQALYLTAAVITYPGDNGPVNVTPTQTIAVGSYKPNPIGLFDMAGNVSEWCWDYYLNTYYISSPPPTNNPTGPTSGSARVIRGGNWKSYSASLCCASRKTATPTGPANTLGFRCVRTNSKQVPIPNGTASASAITYGQTLEAAIPSLNSSGTFVDQQSLSIPGSWSFQLTNHIPTVGSNLWVIIFTPSDPVTYDVFTTSIGVNVQPLPVSLTGSRTYDGTATAQASLLGVANRIGSDVVSLTGGPGTLDGKAVGLRTITGFGSLALTGAAAANYTTNGASGSVTITPATLIVSAAGKDKVYDGNTNATVTLNYSALSGDTVTESFTNAGFSDKNVGTNKTVTVLGLSVGGADGGNYTNSAATATTTANITPRALTATAAPTASSKPYDGSSSATNTVILILNNAVAGDSITTNFTAQFSDPNAGTGKLVTVGNITLGGADAHNYVLNNTNAFCSGTINRLPLAILANNTNWDATTSLPAFTVKCVGFLPQDYSGDTNRLVGTNTVLGTNLLLLSFANTNLPSGTYSNFIIPTVSGTVTNYALTLVPGTLTITNGHQAAGLTASGGIVSSESLTNAIGTNHIDAAGLNAVLNRFNWPAASGVSNFPASIRISEHSFSVTLTNYTVQFSSNLVDWVNLPVIFTDTNAVDSHGFYRLPNN